jgi:hypothetical protein
VSAPVDRFGFRWVCGGAAVFLGVLVVVTAATGRTAISSQVQGPTEPGMVSEPPLSRIWEINTIGRDVYVHWTGGATFTAYPISPWEYEIDLNRAYFGDHVNGDLVRSDDLDGVRISVVPTAGHDSVARIRIRYREPTVGRVVRFAGGLIVHGSPAPLSK